jgi:putative glycosyltransferase (TIGR04348 family)
MRILLVTPASPNGPTGNDVTASRYARLLKQPGSSVTIDNAYANQRCDLMIALHARRSSASIRRYRTRNPDAPLIVVLTGTDLYNDIKTSSEAQESLEAATRLVVLQRLGLRELPARFHGKTRVIYQSATWNGTRAEIPKRYFRVCVIGNLRPEKDPLRAAAASRFLPDSSRIRIVHAGYAMDREIEAQAIRESERNPRYRWLGGLPQWKARRLLAGSHLLALTSRIEGSSNALGEALTSGTPVVASHINGLVGTLGDDYPGYFAPGDTRALAVLLERAESDPRFYRSLKSACARLKPLVAPERELKAWKRLLEEVKKITG